MSIQGGDIDMESLDNPFLKFNRKSLGLEFNNTDVNYFRMFAVSTYRM